MPFPKDIDIDKVIALALRDISTSIKEWLQGQPTSEEALMNRITANLHRPNRSCDVGIKNDVRMISQMALLHRQGPNQTDLYGADLAVTIRVMGEENLVKTALFQLKQSDDFKVTLERKQLEDALIDERIGQRSFVLLADKGRTGVKLAFAPEILKQFDGRQKTKEFDASTWMPVTTWLTNWLSCDIGQPSQLNDPNSIESLLQQYVFEEAWVRDWSIITDFDFTSEYLPARTWLYIFFAGRDTYKRLKQQLKRKR
jgi:hypothetical protein